MAFQKIPSGNEDTNSFRCKRCGFWCNLERDKTGDGEGVALVSTTDGSRTYYDPQHRSGCPLCNTKNYMNWQK